MAAFISKHAGGGKHLQSYPNGGGKENQTSKVRLSVLVELTVSIDMYNILVKYLHICLKDLKGLHLGLNNFPHIVYAFNMLI